MKSMQWVLYLGLLTFTLSEAETVPDYLTEKLFTTKTEYDAGRSLLKSFLQDVEPGLNTSQLSDGNLYPSDRCQPAQLTMFVRHGARHPSDGDIEDVTKFFELFKKMQIASEYDSLKQWNRSVVFNMDKESILTDMGFKELQMIGRRFVRGFPTLFEKVLSKPTQISVKSSHKQRAIKSAEGYMTGVNEELMSAKSSGIDVSQYASKIEPAIRFYDDCKRYIDTVSSIRTSLLL